MPSPAHLLLSLADDPLLSVASSPYARLLDTTGRWAVTGHAVAPLLAWPVADAAAAQAAADRAAQSRGRLVMVVTRDAAEGVQGRDIQMFTDAFEPVLHAATAQSAAKARRLRTEADKLEAFCLVVRAASQATDQAAFAEVGRAASKALRAKFGGGSITSAFAWLAGDAGRQALHSALAGEVELAGKLSVRQVDEAVQLARQAETLQGQG